ncbi:LOW QUALITY PROTEIN: semaphorin-4E-like [Cottoperca gobio]|uniref:LOW QUALITY PROTEIN: semaphorin-4E-like n=1 Tax=Cottoperca gobio TaxID=56716 RepID=A0A6J2S5T3_COTGO|nr:LOW QUALITY PROTEIN: semaphorin-4E-like [Cottoperca gobio]
MAGQELIVILSGLNLNLKQFRESGFGSLSSLMIRDDIGQLVVGARGKVLTLSLEDITKRTSEANWTVSSADKAVCQMKGKATKECDNFIRTLHTMEDGKMLVCGTNAFNPACDYMTFTNGKVSLEGKKQMGRGKVPFDPYQRFASLMTGNTLYSAASSNFLGTELLFQRHGLNPLKTEMKRSWFNCKLLLHEESTGACSQSAVCSYKLSDISQVFSGRFMTARDTGSWDTYTGEQPIPHPGSCINDKLRAEGVMTSLDLSDKTLLFVKNHPLMEGVVTPIAGKPLLVRTGTRFSKIVVDQVTSLDGRWHQVMFIGTDSGWLQKAVRFDGEDGRVIEELQLFETPQFVNFLQLSSKTGQLYSGANNVAVQVNVRDCSRYISCDDCLLARDPYCGWDKIGSQCASVVGSLLGSMIQRLTEGDIRMCPISDVKKKPTIVHLITGIAQFLPCSPEINLPICWRLSDNMLLPGPRHTVLSLGLIIRPSYSDSGISTCETVETVKGIVHRKTVVQYFVQVQDTSNLVRTMKAAVIILAALAFLLILIICRKKNI